MEFLRAYRDSVQLVVDGVWGSDQIPSERKLHKQYYSQLRSLGFRAHHVSEIYRRAREVVESAKNNSGSKPVLRRLTARVHPLDYKLDLSTRTIRVAVLHDRWVELKLRWYSYLDKYLDGSWKPGEVLVSYRCGRFYVYITFHRDVVPREPQTVVGVDINFSNVTYSIVDLGGNLISMGVIPFRGLSRALHYRKLAEGLQRRYPRSWRFLRWARRVRARNILVDSAPYISRRLVEVAREYNAVIVFENLEKLRENSNSGRKLSWERPMWCYRRIQEYAEYKAFVGGIKVIYANPAGTSRRSPNGKKLEYVNYRLVQLGGAITTRDVVASWNLALRGLKRMRGSRVRWSPDSPAGEGMRTRPNAGNPEVENYSQLTVGIYR